jgi:hypothetical protein
LHSPYLHLLFVRVALLRFSKKKPAQNISVAGFTIRSLIPVVTNWGYQFIASTHLARLKRLDPVEHGRCQRARFRVIELLLAPCSFHGQVEHTTKTEFAS